MSPNGVIVLRSSNIKDGKLHLGDIVRVKKIIPDKLWIEKNDIIICARNGSKKLVGKSAIVEEVKEPMTFGAFMAICKTHLWLFVYYFLQSDLFFSQLREVSGTTTINQLTQNSFNSFLLPIPPADEQNRISAKLQTLLPIIEKYGELQDALDELNGSIKLRLQKSILQEAIQGKLVPQEQTEEPAAILLNKILEEKHKLLREGKLKKKDVVDSVIFKGEDNKYYEKIGNRVLDISEEVPFEIPDSWEWTRLASIANLYTGNSISETEKREKYTGVSGMDYIGTKDVGFNSKIDYNNGVSVPSRYLPDFKIAPAGSVLLCIEGGSAGRKIAILEKTVCFGNKLCCFSPYADLSHYLFFYLQSPSFFEIFQKNKTGIIGGVSVNTLKDLLVAVPPVNEQVRIVTKIQSLKL